MSFNGKRGSHDEISNIRLLDLHLLLSRSLVCGGYCAGLIESNATLSGCLDEQSNFEKSLKYY